MLLDDESGTDCIIEGCSEDAAQNDTIGVGVGKVIGCGSYISSPLCLR